MSVFLDRPARDHVARNALAFAIRDGFPVSPGHTLVIPFRVVPTWFEASPEEQRAILALVDEVKVQLDAGDPRPDGYNVGFNAGAAAGQTVMHLHVHVIPRYLGDVPDPRGGVRHVIVGKGNYLSEKFVPAEAPKPRSDALATGGDDPFLSHLRPLLRGAVGVDVVAAFVQETGVEVLVGPLQTMAQGATLRLITGDYLEITQADALRRLHDWQQGGGPTTSVEVRVVETAALASRSRSFHPKAWIVRGEGGDDVAFVGSSNVSRAALTDGVEWNLRLERARDAAGFARITTAFEALWRRARPLDAAWIAAYARRARTLVRPPAPDGDGGSLLGEVEADDATLVPPTPHEVQREALEALAAARAEGRARALVVFATGLGKTWLAAFDYKALAARLRRLPRLLFLAHRRELLTNAASVFRTLTRSLGFVDIEIGFAVAGQRNLAAPLVFGSVQTLVQPDAQAMLRGLSFDLVVVDEAHHAEADSYRKVLGAIHAGFVLGLTATPDRADRADIEGLFDDFVAATADIGRGIDVGRLVPIAYHGLRDSADYAKIPWRSGRFDADALDRAVATHERMDKVWEAWQRYPGTRTLVFCCSIAHADFVARSLAERGVACRALHSGSSVGTGRGSVDQALDALRDGQLQALVTVDLLNEGIDVPNVDRVIFLRPSDSPVVFLQQLGRGLRAAAGKSALTVLDLVGNHTVFLRRLQALLDALPHADAAGTQGAETLQHWLKAARGRGGSVAMPARCTMNLELEAIALLQEMLAAGQGAAAVALRRYRELVEAWGRRPTAGELYRLGINPRTLGGKSGDLLGFLLGEGALTEAERAALAGPGGALLRELQRTAMTPCFKMVALQVLIESGVGNEGLGLATLTSRSLDLLRRNPELRRDLLGVRQLGSPADDGALATLDPVRFAHYWRNNPIAAWLGESGRNAHAFLRLDEGSAGPTLRLRHAVPESQRAAFEALLAELFDWRLAEHRRRSAGPSDGRGVRFFCKVLRNGQHAILKLPPRTEHPDLPEGEADARLPDGSVWCFRFAREFVNVAHPAGTVGNRLGTLLAQWFGSDVGQPGTMFEVGFERGVDGLFVAPVDAATAPTVGPKWGARVADEALDALGLPPLRVATVDMLRTPTTLRDEGHIVGDEAWVLYADAQGGWRSGGHAHRDGDAWTVDEVDFATWKRFGPPGTRSASRALEPRFEAAARALVERLLVAPGPGHWVGTDGKRCRLVGRSAQGGLRVDGGAGGFAARTISVTDLGWALAAREVVARNGGVVDEALVNRLRYLRGTPKGATRWVDSGWAIVVSEAG